MKLYEKNLEDYVEITYEELELGLENGTIETHVVEEGVSASEIYDNLARKGIEQVDIVNGVYCKIVYGTREAINSIPPKIIYVKGDNYGSKD